MAQRRYDAARVSAALAVAGLIIGWALAQQPLLLAHLTLAQAAAPGHDHRLLVAIAMGAVILFPSLALLFGLVLRGRFDPGHSAADAPVPATAVVSALSPGLSGRLAVAGLLGGLGFLTAADAPWATSWAWCACWPVRCLRCGQWIRPTSPARSLGSRSWASTVDRRAFGREPPHGVGCRRRHIQEQMRSLRQSIRRRRPLRMAWPKLAGRGPSSTRTAASRAW